MTEKYNKVPKIKPKFDISVNLIKIKSILAFRTILYKKMSCLLTFDMALDVTVQNFEVHDVKMEN
jgi:hypothetical protein